jgi:CBS domain-containing protein
VARVGRQLAVMGDAMGKHDLPAVAEYMTANVFTLRPEQDIEDAVDFFLSRQVSGAPVVDAAGTLVGILSEKDCLKLFAGGAGAEMPTGTVAEFMVRDVKTIPPTMDIYYCAGLFLKSAFRRFPVVDDETGLVGQISRRDVLRAIQDNLRDGIASIAPTD